MPVVAFGPPPDPERPAPHFIGVPSTQFNAVSAQTVYRGMIDREKNGRYLQQAVPQRPDKDARLMDGKMGDMLPGYRTIDGQYWRSGWSVHPGSGQRLPPSAPEQTNARVESGSSRTPQSMRRARSDFSGSCRSCSGVGSRARTAGQMSASSRGSSRPAGRSLALAATATVRDGGAAPGSAGGQPAASPSQQRNVDLIKVLLKQNLTFC